MDKIEEVLTRGVDKIYPTREGLEKVLRSDKKLTLYQGFDPTGTQLHIGHMTGLMKLRQFQNLGHKVIFLIGDGTGQAGDPSGKTKARDKFFTRDELRKNAIDYVKQASKIVRFEGENAAEIKYNSDWLNKLSLPEILDLIGHVSWQQLAERDLFQERIKSGETLNLREAIYPLLQGYDSVAMKVDLEIGGSDQTFNMLIGRQLVKDYLNKEKFVLTTSLLTDSDGKKIGKTEGNVTAITAPANDLYGMVMSLGDDVIAKCFENLTEISMAKVREMEKKIQAGKNPMVFKKQLAFELTKMLNDEKAAQGAQENFEKTVQSGEMPTDIPTFKVTASKQLLDIIVEANLVTSKSEARRLVEQGAVEVDGKKVRENLELSPTDGTIIKAGKRKFIKLIVN